MNDTNIVREVMEGFPIGNYVGGSVLSCFGGGDDNRKDAIVVADGVSTGCLADRGRLPEMFGEKRHSEIGQGPIRSENP